MSKREEKAIVAGEEAGGGGGGVSLGKGAWDCDSNSEIPPEKEAIVFEEIANMDLPFEGIPTVPPRKDMDHFAFFCNGCRYRVTGIPQWKVSKVRRAGGDACTIVRCLGCRIKCHGNEKTMRSESRGGMAPVSAAGTGFPAAFHAEKCQRHAQVKQALFKGGLARSNKPAEVRNTPGIQKWEDIELIYAGQRMDNDETLSAYHVPPVCSGKIRGGRERL